MVKHIFAVSFLVGLIALPILSGCGGSSVDPAAKKVEYSSGDSVEEQIIFAVKSGDLSTLNGYMEQEPKLATMYDKLGMTLLHHAAGFSQVKVVEYLLEKGADINARARTGETPLAYANERAASEEMIRFLEEKGATE